jgi:hypothetical protein
MSAKHRPKKEGSRKKNRNEGSGKKERHEPNLGQVEAREEKEKLPSWPIWVRCPTSLSRNVDSCQGHTHHLRIFQKPLNRAAGSQSQGRPLLEARNRLAFLPLQNREAWRATPGSAGVAVEV